MAEDRPPTIWEDNSPDSLRDICARSCVLHLETFTTRDEQGRLQLQEGIYLPSELAERILHSAQKAGLDLTDEFISLFQPEFAKIRHAGLRGSSISDKGLGILLRHNLKEVDIHNCFSLSVQALHSINKYSGNLSSLCIGSSVRILPDYLQPQGTFSDSDSEEERDGNIYENQGFILRAPRLRRLCVRDLVVKRGPNYFDTLLRTLPGLTHLDLSGAIHNQGMKSFSWLQNCPALVSLCLHNVPDIETGLTSLCQLRELQHLDISQCDDPRGQFREPVSFLQILVESLPNLTSLDISGTNLAGPAGKRTSECGIAGLAARLHSPLNFLGLYKTQDEASDRANIPARVISGDSKEEQILVAGQRYFDRPTVLENILNDLFHVFRFDNCQNIREALDVLLMAMERHIDQKHIQISGSASLYYVAKSETVKRDLNLRVKRKILSTLLNGMLTHRADPTMMRNGCLTLCQFQIPQDVLFDYERLVRILLHCVSEHTDEQNNFIQRAGIFLLNSLACQVDGQQKRLVGRLGAIEKMLLIIAEKLAAGICDDVMETAWSTMWNVTDETPANCERFLNGNGMQLFLRCKEKFPDKQDLLRNMMGLLGNVAEVPVLRHKLMTKEFVDEFSFLLDSNSDGIEVSYNAAGVLSHMASDGPEAWTIEEPQRDFVLRRLVRAVSRWDLNSRRNINYRSFEPIIRLLSVSSTPECQLWATWALANLTQVTPEKYCRLVNDEGGLAIIEEILNSNSSEVQTSREDVIRLAQHVRRNVTRWKENGQLAATLDYDG